MVVLSLGQRSFKLRQSGKLFSYLKRIKFEIRFGKYGCSGRERSPSLLSALISESRWYGGASVPIELAACTCAKQRCSGAQGKATHISARQF